MNADPIFAAIEALKIALAENEKAAKAEQTGDTAEAKLSKRRLDNAYKNGRRRYRPWLLPVR